MPPQPQPQQSPYPAQQPPQPSPYPAVPLPAPYGGPPQPTPTPQPGTPIPAPSPSGFFYPNAGMLDPTYSTPTPTPNPSGGAVFTPNPPPFTDAMFIPKDEGNKKILIGGGAVLGVAAVAGLVFALTGGGSNKNQPIATGTTKSAVTSTSASPTPTVSPSCSAQSVNPAADWPLNGTGVGCANVGELHLFGNAGYENSARGEVLKVNGQGARATMPLGSLVDTAHSFTVSVWVDVSTLPKTTRTAVAFQGKTLDAFELQYDASASSWAFGRSSVDATGAQWVLAADAKPALTHAWTHLVGVYDSTGHSLTLYVNGVKAATRAGVSGWAATGKITVGASLDATGKPYQNLDGELSEVEIFSAALPQNQVDALK